MALVTTEDVSSTSQVCPASRCLALHGGSYPGRRLGWGTDGVGGKSPAPPHSALRAWPGGLAPAAELWGGLCHQDVSGAGSRRPGSRPLAVWGVVSPRTIQRLMATTQRWHHDGSSLFLLQCLGLQSRAGGHGPAAPRSLPWGPPWAPQSERPSRSRCSATHPSHPPGQRPTG